MVPPVGLVCAALAPGVVILLLVRRYYEAQITTGQLLGGHCIRIMRCLHVHCMLHAVCCMLSYRF
jgi:hypothetical protein